MGKFGLILLLVLFVFGGFYFFREKEPMTERMNLPPEQSFGTTPERMGGPVGELEVESQKSPENLVEIYDQKEPRYWGESVPGVVVGIDTEEKILALTLDACDGDYDRKLITRLREEEIPATLFVASPWLVDHEEELGALGQDPLFDIAGHGKDHLPLSVTGREVYGQKGTESPEQVIEEIMANSDQIDQVIGQTPFYFRSGTAYYDEVAVKIARDLGKEVIGFTVAADGGATLGKREIEQAVLGVEPGGIILAHMNHPNSEIEEGLLAGILALRDKGYEFVQLKEYREEFLFSGQDQE